MTRLLACEGVTSVLSVLSVLDQGLNQCLLTCTLCLQVSSSLQLKPAAGMFTEENTGRR